MKSDARTYAAIQIATHSKMKRLFRIFELTKNEQRVVLIVMLILITITLVTYERRVDHHPTQVTSTIGVEPSPKLVSSVGPPISGASQKAKPMSATVSVVASEFEQFYASDWQPPSHVFRST